MNPPATMYVILSLHGGGAERLLTNILLQQTARHRVTVVTLMPGGVFRPILEEAGIEVLDLGMQSNFDALRGTLHLARLIRERCPDVVHGWMYHANLLLLVARLLAGRPTPRLFWGVFCSEVPVRQERWTVRLVLLLNRYFSGYVEGVVYNAVEARDHHRAIGFREQRSVVISNSIDPDVFRQDVHHRGAVREELGIAPGEVVIAVVARVDPMKDWPAIRQAVHGLPGVTTVAVGKGTDRFPPQQGFLGLGWRDDVVRILNMADLFLLGSAFGEGTSLALSEAMLCGLPCVVTDVGGNGTLVGEGGIVVAPGNPTAMREAILALAGDPRRRETMGQAAHARARTRVLRDDAVQQLHLSVQDERPR